MYLNNYRIITYDSPSNLHFPIIRGVCDEFNISSIE